MLRVLRLESSMEPSSSSTTDSSSKSKPAASTTTEKRLRVTDLRREKYATTNAVTNLLKKAREEGIPDHLSESTQHRYRRALCARKTNYGELVEMLDIPPTSEADQIAIQNPFAMLHFAVQESAMAEVFLNALEAYGDPSPEKPWRLIFYHDEVGISPLANVDARKTLSVYWSFLEFGRKQLSCETAWFVIAAIRASIISELDGQTSYTCKVLLKQLFCRPDFSLRTGILLHIINRERPLLLFAELFLLLQWI